MLGSLNYICHLTQRRACWSSIGLLSSRDMQQKRGKKWKSKHWGRSDSDQQNRQERCDKRNRRRAGNRELRRLLSTDCTSTPMVKQVEDRVREHLGLKRPFEAFYAAKKRQKRRKFQGSSSFYEQADFEARREEWDAYAWTRSDYEQAFQRRQSQVHSYWAEVIREWVWANNQSSRPSRDSFWNAFPEPKARCWGAYHQFTSGQKKKAYQWSSNDGQVSHHLGILGLHPHADLDSEKLRAAFLKAAMQWHPDKHALEDRARAVAEEKFKQIQASYKFLQLSFAC